MILRDFYQSHAELSTSQGSPKGPVVIYSGGGGGGGVGVFFLGSWGGGVGGWSWGNLFVSRYNLLDFSSLKAL